MGTAAAEINSAQITSRITMQEKFKDAAAATDALVTTPTYDLGAFSYTPSSDPPGKYYSGQVLALVAGAATIDLTSLPGLQAVIDATGLKLNVLRIRGEADGSNGALTISEGAANPYELFGGANPIIYPAGCRKPWTFEFDDKLDNVSATDCEIDLAGTGTDSFFIELILG